MTRKNPTRLKTEDGVGFTPGPVQIEIREGHYAVRFAQTPEELDAALKLRFEVFNLELAEGLDASFLTGRDRDGFDAVCHHLVLFDRERDEAAGTYRVQTSETARNGFYSAGEFDLSHLPAPVLEQGVELGRACIAQAHRSPPALFLLWRGLVAYLLLTRKRYLFGCCSLTSQDPRDAWSVMRLLEEAGHRHRDFFVPPREGFACLADGATAGAAADEAMWAKIPKLFRTYLRYGAKVCGPPAIDRQFKTIDFFVIFDLAGLDLASRAFFGA